MKLYSDKGCRTDQEFYHLWSIYINDLKGIIIEETNVLHIIYFSAITVKPKCAFLQTLPVKISLDVIKITGKLSHTVRMIRLIIPFDRGRIY